MALTASTLVQETARADRAALSAGRTGPAGGAADAFAQMLQSRVGPQGAEAAGTGPSAAVPMPQPAATPPAPSATLSADRPRPAASTAQGASTGEGATTAADTAAEAPRAGSAAARAAARPGRGSAAGATATAGDEAVGDARGEGGPAPQTAVPTGADSLAQWLMQIGVIPALAVAAPPASGGAAGGGEPVPTSDEPALALLAGGRPTVFRRPGDDAMAMSLGRAVADAADGRGGPVAPDSREPGAGVAFEPSRSIDAAVAPPASALPAERFGELLLEQGGGLAGPETAPTLEAAGLAAWSAAPTTSPAASTATPTVVEATLSQPFDDPEARAELLLQVGRFVREGIGEARLHLNPAEMGPIQIHIAMDGQAARIDFVAAQAATRELLQSSLAALAESLGADGLTLVDSQVHAEMPRSDAAGAQTSSSGGSGFGRGGPGDDRGRSAPPPSAGPAARGTGASEGPVAASSSVRSAASSGAPALDLYA